jgi:hypothetical protein
MNMQIFESKTVEQSGLRYKIQLRKNNGLWQQRHIWFECKETEPAHPTLDHFRIDPWIAAVQCEPDTNIYKPV